MKERRPDHWKWGLFYYNPDDPDFFVERPGRWKHWHQDINWAHRSAIWLMIFILFFPLIGMWLILLLR